MKFWKNFSKIGFLGLKHSAFQRSKLNSRGEVSSWTTMVGPRDRILHIWRCFNSQAKLWLQIYEYFGKIGNDIWSLTVVHFLEKGKWIRGENRPFWKCEIIGYNSKSIEMVVLGIKWLFWGRGISIVSNWLLFVIFGSWRGRGQPDQVKLYKVGGDFTNNGSGSWLWLYQHNKSCGVKSEGRELSSMKHL